MTAAVQGPKKNGRQMHAPTVIVGLVVSEEVLGDTRRVAATHGRSHDEVFAQAVVLQLSEYGGVRGIQDSYANGGPMKLVVLKQNTDTSMCDVVLH